MKPEEKVAERYLTSLGFQNVEYEPDRNVPPDFLADGRIAAEVRRLNQNAITATGLQGIEEEAIPLHMGMRTFLASFGAPTSGKSWFVSYRLKRPLPRIKPLREALRPHLERFKQVEGIGVDRQVNIPGVTLRIFPASNAHSALFVPGGGNDQDAGGFVLDETIRNVALCMEEKAVKIAAYRPKYPEWWLVLVDHIGYGVEECDRETYRQQLTVGSGFDRIVLLDPTGYLAPFEIERRSS